MTGADLAIRVANLSKCYHIYDKPQDRLKQSVLPRLHRLAHPFTPAPARNYFREFWALNDVSFEVRRGESIGIIGRNGAGKSTLLQLIAGTLAPTRGTIEVSGRVAALLELGSGFNTEFTGRENVYLNAALLGLTHEETDAKFDEIAAFADIGDFMEQPVKNYSSGMLMRVAFAVQTAVHPSVLIVDEALAVGDVFFQAKCMARLRRLIDDGVTLLFVSHDSGTIRQLCQRAVLLQHGSMLAYGSAGEVTDSYLRLELQDRNEAAVREMAARKSTGLAAADQQTAARVAADHEVSATQPPAAAPMLPGMLTVGAERFAQRAAVNRSGNGFATVRNVLMLKDGEPRDVFDFGDRITLRQVVHFDRTLSNVNVSYKIRTAQGTDVVFGDTRLLGEQQRVYLAGRTYVFDWTFELNLMHGTYCIMTGITQPPDGDRSDWLFIDMVPLCYDFRVAPRKRGMIDGFVAWDCALRVEDVGTAPAITALESR